MKDINGNTLFNLIAGHSDYHGNDILRAILIMQEGRELDNIPPIDAETVRHGHWELRYEYIENDDGWQHNRCSHCKRDAAFYPTFAEDWDEDIDGEWVSLGIFQNGIEEFLTDYCPNCGAKMDEVTK
ncbi:MAG: hypothetical protein MJZ37_10550 [Bacilli bacterium]|nr:hypothetical protein [Bacilli bacterium]